MVDIVLVLTRRIGESINIGGVATITVLDVNTTKKVRFGIESPELLVRRAEVVEREDVPAQGAEDAGAEATKAASEGPSIES